MTKILKKIFFIVPKERTKALIFILLLTLLNTAFELIGIGLIIPMLTYFVGEAPNFFFQKIFLFENMSQTKILTIILLLFNLIYIFKFICSTSLILQKNKFDWFLFSDLSKKIFSNYLNKSYILHLSSSLSEKIQVVRGETNIFSFGVMRPLVELIVEFILFLSICLFLLFYNFKISLIIISLFSLLGFLWNKYYNHRLEILGKKRQRFSIESISEIQNSFKNFKETTIYQLKNFFLERFRSPNIDNSIVGYKRDTILAMPRLILELMGVTGIIIIFFFLISKQIQLTEILITLGVFMFATVRILPSISKIVRALQSIKFNFAVIDKVYDELKDMKEIVKNEKNKTKFENICLENVSFKFPNSSEYILKNINLKISKGSKIGIIGKTGSGKSTLINLICGLINKSEGKILINSKEKTNNDNDYLMNKIAYVSHDSFMLNESIEYNISLKDEGNTDKILFKEVVKQTELSEFIDQLKLKEKTLVGENGNSLSRGQCQRVSIARALYSGREIIVFDEGTSALDIPTEDKILASVYNKLNDKTIISVSHRKNSLRLCDNVYEVVNRKLNKV